MTDSFAEFEFIDRVRRRAAGSRQVPLGIGDDAAELRLSSERCLVAADALFEGVHFTMPPASARQVGRKALAVNLSDLAAMAARPVAAFFAVAFPRSMPGDLPDELTAGLLDLADEFETVLAGGDTNVWDGPLVVSVTAIGEPTGRGPVARSGAQPGDWILATGEFGGSLTGRHLDFTPRVREALQLHELVELHAMIDVSDGLAADLHHILDESSVGAVVFADRIPIAAVAQSHSGERTPLDRALSDGEDFELLFAVDADDGRRLISEQPLSVPLTQVGEIVAGTDCKLMQPDGRIETLDRRGWTHNVTDQPR